MMNPPPPPPENAYGRIEFAPPPQNYNLRPTKDPNPSPLNPSNYVEWTKDKDRDVQGEAE
jgi:hypothetical protein